MSIFTEEKKIPSDVHYSLMYRIIKTYFVYFYICFILSIVMYLFVWQKVVCAWGSHKSFLITYIWSYR